MLSGGWQAAVSEEAICQKPRDSRGLDQAAASRDGGARLHVESDRGTLLGVVQAASACPNNYHEEGAGKGNPYIQYRSAEPVVQVFGYVAGENTY